MVNTHAKMKSVASSALKVILVVSFVVEITPRQEGEQTCNDFTIDKCQYDDNGLLETLKDVTETDCQFYCDVIYKGLCNFFIYDHKQVICELLAEPFGNYVDTCRKVGGPPNPTVESCEKSTDPCKVY